MDDRFHLTMRSKQWIEGIRGHYDGRSLTSARWLGEREVMGMSDCLIALLDGVNDAGLAVSLTCGGRRVAGRGFGIPIVLRYVLETCETASEAGKTSPGFPHTWRTTSPCWTGTAIV